MRRAFILLIFCVLTVWSTAQKRPVKWGKIDIEDLRMQACPTDSGACALVLCDFGEGFTSRFVRHIRIKILSPKGVDYGNVLLKSFHNVFWGEPVNIKGATYNLDENGEIIVSKLDHRDILEKKHHNKVIEKSFALPNVKVGSVIEYTYTVLNGYMNKWYFQREIPVRYSEYRPYYPIYFFSEQVIRGPVMFSEKGESTQTNGMKYRYVMKDVPALKTEPFTGNLKDNFASVEFYINKVQVPGYPVFYALQDEKDLNDKLMKFPYPGRQLDRIFSFRDILVKIIEDGDSEIEKMQKIHKYVVDNIEWDKTFSLFNRDMIREVFSQGKGTSSELNTVMTILMQDAGLHAHLVYVSTRGNGSADPRYIEPGDFNHVLCLVEIKKDKYILDATNPYYPPGQIPIHNLNGKGFAAGYQYFFRWIDLEPVSDNTRLFMGTFEFTANDRISGNLNIINKGYMAATEREKYALSPMKSEYMSRLIPVWNRLETDTISFENPDVSEKPFVIRTSCSDEQSVFRAGNKLIIEPLFFSDAIENPFKTEKRNFPVDFAYPFENKYILNLKIPDGYVVSELPEAIEYKLPDNSARFVYLIKSTGNMIQLTCETKFTKATYGADQYQLIKNLFGLISSKHREKIVLTKI